MSRAAAVRTSKSAAIEVDAERSTRVASTGSDVPVPPPSAFTCASTSRNTSATTHVPMAK